MRQSDRAPNLWVADDVLVPDDVYLGVNVVLHSGVVLGPGCHVEDGAVLGKLTRPGSGSTSPAAPAEPTVLGAGTVVGTYAVVCAGATTGAEVFLGDHSLTREGAVLGARASIGHAGTVGRDARIGERVRTQGYAALAAGVVIEDDVFLGPLVSVLAGLTMREGEDPGSNVSAPAILRRGCHIGSGAQILPGVEIGEHAVVGANAVVVHDVPAGARVRGVPAR
jgi:acetyltransferase-like isoleucine patch superfamily enzyme